MAEVKALAGSGTMLGSEGGGEDTLGLGDGQDTVGLGPGSDPRVRALGFMMGVRPQRPGAITAGIVGARRSMLQVARGSLMSDPQGAHPGLVRLSSL